jgi:hypothetical protein
MEKMAQSIYLTDLDACEPAAAISSRWGRTCWRAVPYETVDGLTGRMLMAPAQIDPPPVRYPADLKGWYRIFVGFGCPTDNESGLPTVKVKLTDDPAYTVLAARGRYWWMEFREFFWKDADLTGQAFHFAKPNGLHNGGPTPVSSYPAYLRLEALDARQVEALQRDRENRANPSLIGTEDGWSALALNYPKTVAELYENILPYQHSDVRTVLYCAASGDVVNYPETAVGTTPQLSGQPIYPRYCDQTLYESLEALRRQKIDPLGALCDFAHEIGLEFHANIRSGSFACEPPFDEFFVSDFYRDHPEYRCRDKAGREIPRLSYAFPEVQRHMLALCAEIAERNLDGFGWIYVRALPVVLYEQPLLDAFARQYGTDARELPDDDERVCTCRATIYTDFLRQVKRSLDALRRRQGRGPLQYSVIVPANRQVNHRLGLDLKTWAREGLIDILGVDWSVQDRNNPRNEVPENMELDYFQEVVKGTPCRLAPRLGRFDDERGPQEMASLHARGIPAGLIWDTASCYQYAPNLWTMVRQYGHRDLVREWAAKGVKPDATFISLKTLGGFTMDQYPGNLAY